MMLVGLDIATRSGIAVINGERVVHVESFKSKVERPKELKSQEIDVEYEALVAEQFRQHFNASLAAWQPDAVALEEPRTRDFERTKTQVNPNAPGWGQAITKTTERASSNLAMVRSMILCAHAVGLCQRKNIPVYRVSSDDWRHAFLGYSRAPRGTSDSRAFLKKAVKSQCELLGINVPNDDAGDSVGVAWWLRGHLNPRMATTVGDLFHGATG